MLAPGCLVLLILFGFLFIIPFLFTQVMLAALAKLGLSAGMAVLVLFGILIGGTINIPVRRIEREQEVVHNPLQLYGLGRLMPRLPRGRILPLHQPTRTYTVLAVNVGGCLIPLALVLYETARIVNQGAQTLVALLVIVTLNIGVCYRLARPIPNLGIAMPTLVPPLVATIPSLLLVPNFAPPVAFVAGVLGPLVGADLLHLDEIERLQTGMASIGGAGTFDGIVLSGLFAALLA